MRRTTILTAAAIAVMSGPLQAQRTAGSSVAATGVITDYSTGSTISGALIEFPALRRQATTDINGRFTIYGIRPGRHKMVVNQLGFKTLVREVEIRDGELLYIPLDPDPVMLKGIDVQVDRLELRRRGLGSSVSTFGRQLLLNSAAFSAEDFLRSRLTMIPCGRNACIRRRGQLVQPVVYIDERRAFGLDELEAYPPHDIYMVESYDGGRMIRVYTTWFMQNLARTNMPLQNIVKW